MITLESDHLKVRFAEVHQDACMAISLQRTLRVPDSDKTYPLPPGLGCFPLRHIEDFADRIPASWACRGGVIIPMYQAEAMWINFQNHIEANFPFAVKIGTGKINAVSGKSWTAELNDDPQDYVVVPGQPWLDGYVTAEGVIRQFVAMPLGSGFTVEHHLSGTEEHGGLQIHVYPMRAERYQLLLAERRTQREELANICCLADPMGIAAGGRINQEVYRDEFGVDAWDMRHASRCFVTIVNSEKWAELTEEPIPTKPVLAEDYTLAGLPWFDHYDENLKPLSGSKIFSKLPALPGMKRLREWKDSRTSTKPPVVELGPSHRPTSRQVTEGLF